MNDFTKFFCFVKGTLITAEVIKSGNYELRQDAKLHFNRIMNDCANFEKAMHQYLGPNLAEMEDDVNGAIIGLVWSFFDLSTDDRAKFIDYIGKFELDDKKEEDGTVQD
jgi:hypothetical protein